MDPKTEKYFITSLAVTVVCAVVVIFQNKLGFDMSAGALAALAGIVGTYNLAMGFIEGRRATTASTNPPTVP